MSENIEHWNNVFSHITDKKTTYDLWLDKFKYILEKFKEDNILDLGCGNGADSLYLIERGYKQIISCDYSHEALEIVKKNIPEAETINIDITKRLPFEDNSIGLVIADLVLHYFNEETTKNIVREIKRILKDGGYLIGRVNSVNDINYGVGNGNMIEENFYLTECGYKRFFTIEDIENYFGEFKIEHCLEEGIMKYGEEKRAFEFVMKNV